MAPKVLDILSQKVSFLLIDKIVDLRKGEFISVIKNVTANDVFLNVPDQSHQYMPNAILLESMSQAATALLYSDPERRGYSMFLNEISKSSFLQEAMPGDSLRIEVELVKKEVEKLFFEAKAFLEGQLMAEAHFNFKIANPLSFPKIHPTASVHPSAIIEKDVQIGAYSVIGEEVYIGQNTIIEPHVSIEKWTQIGQDNHIYFGAVIGSQAQDIKYKGEKSWVEIGNGNQIREYVTINRATGEGRVTRLGDNNMLLTNVHVGHNCTIQNQVTIANAVHLGGHVIIEDGATIGGMTGIHQFVRIGKKTMTGGYARLIQDVPPFMLCDGNPAYVRGLNIVGLRRSKLSRESLNNLKEAYRLLYRSDSNVSQAMEKINALDSCEWLDHLKAFLNQDTSRGISKKTDLKEAEG